VSIRDLARSYPRLSRSRLAQTLCALGLLAGLAVAPAAAASVLPPLPGPPPGAGSGYPAAPPPGVTLAAGPTGPAASIPGRVSGPGLLAGSGTVRGRSLSLMVACHAAGTATLSAPAIQSSPLARSRYRCVKGRGAVVFKLSASAAGRVRALGTTIGTVTLGRTPFSLTLATHGVRSAFWTDGGLQCNFLGPNQSYLVAPNFQVTPPAVIDVRPWVAFYTASSGWQWLGTGGLNRSSWYQWTSTPTGVMQWYTPAGALNRWTWAPISVPGGRHLYSVGVFEVEYLYHHPTYAWMFAKSQPNGSGPTTYCSYP
jgi:hypothetical protein